MRERESTSFPQPSPFLGLRVHHLDLVPGLTGLCVGYEKKVWRSDAFADHLMNWLPEFSLSASECKGLGHANAAELMRKAARRVFESQKFKLRGEFGEMLLHIAIRQVFGSLPALSKIYYKSASNETVKGFDAVHVVGPPNDMELWLGEAKFYSSWPRAIAAVKKDLRAHLELDYLRSEFTLITNKLDPLWPHTEVLKKLLRPETSLDEIFSRVCIPVLITYDSETLGVHKKCTEEYHEDFQREIKGVHDAFIGECLGLEVKVHLFLIPLENKKKLSETFFRKMQGWQKL